MGLATSFVLAAAVSAVPTPGSENATARIIHKRDRLTLTVTVGVAQIERQVTALQNARDGQRLFVETGDGDVISVRAEQLR